MAHDYKISEYGLNLIKAYEGFRADATTLVSGQRVIGYGHTRTHGDAASITKAQAETLLLADLAPFETLVNSHVFAPLSQNGFDALVSLSFNIGIEAFLGSDVLHALNLGYPLRAAQGFDGWRKGRVADKVYVVDALVRRRAAEKALFLSPNQGAVAVPRHELPPIRDVAAQDSGGVETVFATPQNDMAAQEQATQEQAPQEGVVARVPYVARANTDKASDASNNTPRRRKEDQAASVLTLSERMPELKLVEPDVVNVTDVVNAKAQEVDDQAPKHVAPTSEPDTDEKASLDVMDAPEPISPIAAAAAEVSERLDNLMDKAAHEDRTEKLKTDQQPPAKNQAVTTQSTNSADTNHAAKTTLNDEPSTPQDNVLSDVDTKSEAANISEDGMAPYWTVLAVGLFLLAGAVWKLYFSKPTSLDAVSAFLAPVSIFIGAMLLLGGLYSLLKGQTRDAGLDSAHPALN